jgi:hypothetical protein
MTSAPHRRSSPVVRRISIIARVSLQAADQSDVFASDLIHEAHGPGWRNAKHRAQWINTLTEYAFPPIGDRPVSAIDTADVLRVLTPIWLEKPDQVEQSALTLGQRL